MAHVSIADLKDFLDEKACHYNNSSFIPDDPVSIPHRYSKKEDIEIAGFLAATISWGQRPVILRNAMKLMSLMDDSPHDFISNFSVKDLSPFKSFVHRTFNGTDCICFLRALQYIYKEYGSLEKLFIQSNRPSHTDYGETITAWRTVFFKNKHDKRSLKHFSNPSEGSAAKRINMFLRWMIRKDSCGVDLGIWNLPPAKLICPLDVHSARVARKLGLLQRKQNDWKAAKELTDALKKLDASDPVKYDFALFGLGVSEFF